MEDEGYTILVCTRENFRPCECEDVRWLDWKQDFELYRDSWQVKPPLSRNWWRQCRREGFRYCGLIKDNRIVASAALWTRPDGELEVAAVGTREGFTRRGYGKAVVSFVTQEIVNPGRTAHCGTRPHNEAMIATARSVGFEIVSDQ